MLKRVKSRCIIIPIAIVLIPILISILFGIFMSKSSIIWAYIYYGIHYMCLIDGYLTIIDYTNIIYNDTTIKYYGNINSNPKSQIMIKGKEYFYNVITSGDIGLGESYVLNDWESNDLESYFRILFINFKYASKYLRILEYISIPYYMNYNILLNYDLHNNGHIDDEKFIHLHYDLGIDLFKLFLDNKTMTYTSAIFGNDNILSNAQINKINKLINKMNINNNDKILDIGCGFGYLLNYIHNKYNNNELIGITLSHDQLNYAINKYNNTNINYLYKNYKEFNNDTKYLNYFDSIVSVEMIEAIGSYALNNYFEIISKILKPNKRFVIQYIAYNDWFFPITHKNDEKFPTYIHNIY